MDSNHKAIAEAYLATLPMGPKSGVTPEIYRQSIADAQAAWKKTFARLSELTHSAEIAVWYALGCGYHSGKGTERNPEKAVHWLRRAADKGHRDAVFKLAQILRQSENETELEESVKLCRELAENGDTSGMVFLGFAYQNGCGVAADPETGAEWLVRAYEAGDTSAAILAGRAYFSEANQPQKAIPWLQIAAKNRQADSYIVLATLHGDHRSPCFDPAEAVKWYQTVVAENAGGRKTALLELARHYRDGNGVPKSAEIAKHWLAQLLATADESSAHYKDGRKLLDEIENQLL